ncbi:MAG: sigma-70 family RNA polymerase sigma factor, partial [Firmicutes bacterium]|nr:sigma-70 family RNA polymerase sigma factor [Bacillota bacterium]
EPKARQVIVLRYYKDCTQQQVADLLGISQVQVCRIEKKTLKMMAEKMAE